VLSEPVCLRRVGIGLVVAAALLTSACAAGQDAQTAEQKTTLDGTNADLGSIGLRGLAIEAPDAAFYPAGSDAAVKLVLVNSGTRADRLTSITTSSASGWAVYRSTAEADSVQNAAASALAPAPSSSASTPASSTASPPPVGSTSVPVPAGGRVSYGVPSATGALLLLHTKGHLYPGMTVELTFTFANAGTIDVAVPIQLSAGAQISIVPGPSATGQEG
jgi:copper(I)-binding protein